MGRGMCTSKSFVLAVLPYWNDVYKKPLSSIFVCTLFVVLSFLVWWKLKDKVLLWHFERLLVTEPSGVDQRKITNFRIRVGAISSNLGFQLS